MTEIEKYLTQRKNGRGREWRTLREDISLDVKYVIEFLKQTPSYCMKKKSVVNAVWKDYLSFYIRGGVYDK